MYVTTKQVFRFGFWFVAFFSVIHSDAQTFTKHELNRTSISIGGAWRDVFRFADIDKDGDLDYFHPSGYNGNGPTIFVNNGNFSFSDVFIPENHGFLEEVVWFDFDNDNDLDFLIGGINNQGQSENTVVYENKNGSFTRTTMDFPEGRAFTGDHGDVNNDGKSEMLLSYGQIVATGEAAKPDLTQVFSIANDLSISAQNLGMNSIGQVEFGDFNKDGKMDVFHSGHTPSASGYIAYNRGTSWDVTTQSWIGNGRCVDLNNDGFLDVVSLGQDPAVWQNNGNETFTRRTASLDQTLTHAYISFGDVNQNGFADIVAVDKSGNLKIYVNNGNFGFSAQTIDSTLPFAGAAFADMDGDSSLDIVFAGSTNSKNVIRFYENNITTVNAAPSVPTNFAATFVGDTIRLSWNASTDDHTASAGLSYNVILYTATDTIVSPLSLTNGKRQVTEYGNTSLNNFFLIRGIPDGLYSWRVQAIDPAWNASAFSAEQTFDSRLIDNLTVNLTENSAAGTVVGTVPKINAADVLTYSITSGNNLGAFAINQNTGVVTVSNAALIDFESNPNFQLTVSASNASRSTSATVNISLANVNESPVFSSTTFSVPENTAQGHQIGIISATDPEGSPVTITLQSGNGANTFGFNAGTGALTIADAAAFDFETNTSFTLSFQATDGAVPNTQNITVSVTNVNEQPIVTGGPFTLNENAPNGTIVGTLTISDPDGDALNVSFSSGNESGAFAINGNNGAITVAKTEALDFETTPSFTLVTAANDGTLTKELSVTINLNNINESPVFSSTAFSVPENSAQGHQIGTISATDPEGSPVTISLQSGNGANTFGFNASTGALTIADAAAFDFETTTSFTLSFQATDGAVPNTQNITISVTNVNELPTITGGTFALNENSANGTLVGTLTISDPDGDALNVSFSNGNESGAFAINGNTGAITVAKTEEVDFEKTPVFTLTTVANDGSLSQTSTVTINLNDINEAPVFSSSSYAVPENSAQGHQIGIISATDPEGSPVTITLQSGNTANTFGFDVNTGALTIADAAAFDFETNTSFVLSFQATDGVVPNTQNITVSVTNVNEQPAITGGTFALNENSANGTVVGTLTISDPDGDALNVSFSGGNESGAFAINGSTGAITVSKTEEVDFEKTPVFTLTAEANDGSLSKTSTVTINLNNIDEPPVFSSTAFSVAENSAQGHQIGIISATDPEGSPVTISLQTGNEANAFGFNAGTGALTIADAAAFDFETNTSFTLSFLATDGTVPNTQNITVSVTNVNESPSITGGSFTLNENSSNGTIVGTLSISDPDGDALSVSFSSGNESGAFAINGNTGAITVAKTGELDFEKTKTFSLTVLANDGSLSKTSSVTVNLNDVNEAPQFSNTAFNVEENSSQGHQIGIISAADPEGSPVTITLQSGNESNAFGFNGSTGALTIADPTAFDFEKNSSFNLSFQASDGAVTRTQTIVVMVGNVNEQPTITVGSFTLNENAPNGTVVGTLSISDPDGDALNVSFSSGNESGAFAIDGSTGSITVAKTEVLDFETTSTFTLVILVSDGNFQSSETVVVSLVDVIESITFSTNTLTIAENGVVGATIGTLAVVGPAGAAFNFSIISGNENNVFTLNANTGELTIANASAFDHETNATLVLEVLASSGTLSATQTITITITNVNEAPSLSTSIVNLEENAANGTIVGTVNASDPDGDNLTYRVVSGNELGAFDLNENNGVITVINGLALDFETSPTLSLEVEVNDGSLTGTTMFTVNLENVNEAPAVSPATFIIPENSFNGTVVGTVASSDPDGDAVNYAISSGNEMQAFAIDAGNGTITVSNSSALDFEVTPSFELQVEVSDATLSTSVLIKIDLEDLDATILNAAFVANDVVKLYPNPTTAFLNIEDIAFQEARIYSLEGKLMLQANTNTIDVSKLTEGIYLVKLIDAGRQIATLRFVKQ